MVSLMFYGIYRAKFSSIFPHRKNSGRKLAYGGCFVQRNSKGCCCDLPRISCEKPCSSLRSRFVTSGSEFFGRWNNTLSCLSVVDPCDCTGLKEGDNTPRAGFLTLPRIQIRFIILLRDSAGEVSEKNLGVR